MVKSIGGIIVLETRSAQEAHKLAEQMKNCPNLLASGTTGNTVYSVYVVPQQKRWWLEYPESHPEITGAVAAQVHVMDKVIYPEQFAAHLPLAKTATAPCGADCLTCPLRAKYGCPGCPATTHYQPTEARKRQPRHGRRG